MFANVPTVGKIQKFQPESYNRKFDGHLFRRGALVDRATSTPDEIAKIHGHLIGSVVGAGGLARTRARTSGRALVCACVYGEVSFARFDWARFWVAE